MYAAEMAVELDSAPDEQSRGEALKILEHFFGHPAFRSLNVKFALDADGAPFLNWKTKE